MPVEDVVALAAHARAAGLSVTNEPTKHAAVRNRRVGSRELAVHDIAIALETLTPAAQPQRDYAQLIDGLSDDELMELTSSEWHPSDSLRDR